MNRRSEKAGTRLALLGLSLVLGLTSSTRAQGPGPMPAPTPAAGVFVPNEEAYTSGLLSRYVPAPAVLPHDKDRDRWYNTRWGDYLPDPNHPNYMFNSGLYGQRIRPTCTATFAPYFAGRAGRTTSGSVLRAGPTAGHQQLLPSVEAGRRLLSRRRGLSHL